MAQDKEHSRAYPRERIDIHYDYALCAWARHFNVSENRIKEAVAAVGTQVDQVRQHLRSEGRPAGGQERPSSN